MKEKQGHLMHRSRSELETFKIFKVNGLRYKSFLNQLFVIGT